ncbi:MAG: penicillin acylase family protein [Pseudomonadota bacterium]
MKKLVLAGIIVLVLGLFVVGEYLRTPGASFDVQAAIERARDYEARIVRDQFGVPHIYGARDADVAFGLAYAHMEDDWETLSEVIYLSRGKLAERNGRDGAIPDYLIGALGIVDTVSEKYETDLAPETRTLVEAYAAGVNLWCAEHRTRCDGGTAPVTGKDVIAGFVARTPFFYGLDDHLMTLFDGDETQSAAIDAARHALLRTNPAAEIGSNAMAVASQRSADGHTRLMVNSHQPYEGPVAWYEARVKSEEGWDMIGGVFPGAPMILHGTGPDLGWAHTVNKPDLFDAYRLEVDNKKNPTRYRFDGEWRDLDIRDVSFRVKLFGPFSLPVTRKAYASVHGPVFVTDNGVFGVSYGGAGEIRSAEQWYRMNKAKTFTGWTDAMEMGALPSLNVVYADRAGNIAYYYNAAIPVRDPSYDWSEILPGDEAGALWQGVRGFDAAPSVVNPESGYVVNANHTPFKASGEGDNPDPDAFPPEYGVDTRTTNRGFRIQTLYGGDRSITEEEFLSYKMDAGYAAQSRVVETVDALIEEAPTGDPLIEEAIATLKAWDRTSEPKSRSAALALFTAQRARGYLINDEGERESDYVEALREVAAALKAEFGRVDPEWGEVMRFRRGEIDTSIRGGPDALRAVWPTGDIADGPVEAAGGDTYILYADWPEGGGEPEIRTIHQFGAATIDESSPHYADQAPIFLDGRWKSPPMDLDALLAEATEDRVIGGR